ncbi:hypothetical protein [Microcoleus sp. SVA1_A1]|uniref:hypothetical protein n=1 Tax=Microcoleus sp. SVA1_A1 TaxID=2818946 RepID=UPI002FCEDF30
MVNIGTCKLCGQEKELIGKSHIIPRHFYHKTTQEIENHFNDVSQGDKVPRLFSADYKSRQAQSGLYVPDILCTDCENFLGRWDNYAQNFLLKEVNINPLGNNDYTIQQVNSFDYKQLKLFCMSVLWRSHISRDKAFGSFKFFSEVNLGTVWENILRNLLLKEDPSDEDTFSVAIFILTGIEAQSVIPPSPRRYHSVNSYRFRMGNYGFLIKVDRRKFSEGTRKFILKPNQPLKLYVQQYTKNNDYQYVLKGLNNYQN